MCNACIAIVDDEESVRKALGRLLRSAGFGVATYSDGRQLLNALLEHPPDCIVIDLHMPGMNGLEIQNTLCETRFKIPLIFISAVDDSEARQTALAAGAVDFLRKPFPADALFAAIATALAPLADS